MPARGSRPLTCVIGAGPSGLAACRVLEEYAIPWVCHEAGERVGGQWVLGNTSGTSVAYRSLRTNTHKGMSRYSDYALPDHYPDFPDHAQMAAWFGSYAEHFGLHDRIRFGSRVVRAEPRDAGGWEIETAAGEREAYDALVVAVGNLWSPHWPDLPGELDGPVLHARDYMDPRDPVDCTGRSVLVIGLGNTACELAVELSAPGVARSVFLSCRSGQIILPRRVDGGLLPAPHPADPLEGPFRWLPRPARDALFRAVFPRVLRRMTRGLRRPEDVGLPAPASPFEKRPVVNDEIIDCLHEGRVRPKPTLRRLRGGKVEFSDGSVEEIDVVIAATGYRLSLPFFREGLLGPRGDDLELFRGVMHPRFHDLFVVGVMRAICSIWPRAEQQMRWVAPLLAGESALPSAREIARETYPVLGVPFGNCQFHTHDLQCDVSRGRRRALRRKRSGGTGSEV
jgi:cation diffusion facilitator CzcD-associated flavoprotein CzcO